MADVAEMAKVSKMTVSRVLNNKPGVAENTRQRILEVADELGYSLQNQFPISDGCIIALLIPNHPTVYLGEVLSGISAAAEQLNCTLLLYTQNMFSQAVQLDNALSPLRGGLIDGVVVIVPRDYQEVIVNLERYELPFVLIDHHSEASDEASVTATNRRGMLEATRYLLALGHRRIGFITGRMDIACSHERLQGYRDGLEEVGMPFEEGLVIEGDFLQPTGFRNAKALLERDTPPPRCSSPTI